MKINFPRYFLILWMFVVLGCGPYEKDVVGDYSRTGKLVSERLILRSNHVYEQELIYKSGARFTQTNTWYKSGGVIHFANWYSSTDALTYDDIEPPKLFGDSNLVIRDGLLIGSYEHSYYFQKNSITSNAIAPAIPQFPS